MAPYVVALIATTFLVLLPEGLRSAVPMPILVVLAACAFTWVLASSVKVMALARPNMVGFLGLQDDA